MNRRDFLTLCSSLSLGALSPKLKSNESYYDGRLLVQLYARGGWDTTSFCDPKVNSKARKVVNNWSEFLQPNIIGNIEFAPFAKNEFFFKKYYNDILVINGIDGETSSHELGTQYILSGNKDVGHPSLTALFSAIKAPNLPLSYLSFSDYKETASLVNYSRLNNLDNTLEILAPNSHSSYNTERFHSSSALDLIKQAQIRQISSLQQIATSSTQKLSYERYLHSLKSGSNLKEFSNLISKEIENGNIDPEYSFDLTGDLKSQTQIGLLALASGVTASLDLMKPNFDTHSDHDRRHNDRLSELVDDIDYFWEYAKELGIHNRITLVINSELSRTPWYNEQDGKDHWPINSTVIMEHQPSWGNRVIGATDDNLNAIKISKQNLSTSEDAGSIILHPRDIHLSLRKYLELIDHPFSKLYSFDDAHVLDFFT